MNKDYIRKHAQIIANCERQIAVSLERIASGADFEQYPDYDPKTGTLTPALQVKARAIAYQVLNDG